MTFSLNFFYFFVFVYLAYRNPKRQKVESHLNPPNRLVLIPIPVTHISNASRRIQKKGKNLSEEV